MTSRRLRSTLLRLAAPFRRRHPVQLARVESITVRSNYPVRHVYTPYQSYSMGIRTITEANYAAERDPTDEAGA